MAGSAPDTPIGSGWLARFPYRAVALRLVDPLVLDDGERACRYLGCVVAGVRSSVDPSRTVAHTRYVPLPDADGFRALWLFDDPVDGRVGAQTLTAFIRADPDGPTAVSTVGGWVEACSAVYRAAGTSPGVEVAVLAPMTVTVLAYLSSRTPDVVTVAGGRTGPVLRTARVAEVAEVGWRVAPHLRAAHFHRVRVATRDTDGVVTGSTSGVEGDDWHYELRWYPPTPVNATADGPRPVVRDVRPPRR